MKRKIYLAILLIVITGFCLFFQKRHASKANHLTVGITNVRQNTTNIPNVIVGNISPPSSKTPAEILEEAQSRAERMKQESDREVAMWQGPILFYGKVIDESNQPIAGVQVSYNASAMDELRKEIQNTGTITTDARGIFKIDGVNGVGATLELSHSNYYCYPDNINSFDKRAGLPLPTTEYNARLYRMHSKGHPVSLVHRRGGADVPVNGGSVTVDFDSTEYNKVIGKLKIEASGNTPKNWSPIPYDWSVRLTVPDGGLIESTNQFDFIAPNSGYQQSIEIDMAKDQQGWSDSVSKSYFVKLPNGYARMEIHMRAKTPLYVSLDYYYNPDGSQNLESDK